MAKTYEAIATHTLGSAAASYEFTSIPSIYTDLRLIIVDTDTGAKNVELRLNSDTGSNYSVTEFYGTGSAAVSARTSSQTQGRVGYTGSASPSVTIVDLMSYANANVYKTSLSASCSNARVVSRHVMLWRSTSAITSILIRLDSGNLPSGCTFSLYGLAAA